MNITDNYRTAIHEAGHFVAASHYQIPACPEITPSGYSLLVPETSGEAHAGVCHCEPPFSKFQYAVICWSGIMAECMFGIAPAWTPRFPPSARMLRDWHLMILNQVDKLSHADRNGVFGLCDTGDSKKFRIADTWSACKSAFRILRQNRARIKRLADAMTAKDTVPMPTDFPASREDFLRLIVTGYGHCSNTDAEQRLNEFFDSRVKASWSRVGGNVGNYETALPMLKDFFLQRASGDEDTARKLFDDEFQAAVKADVQRCLKTPASWRAAALHFRRWVTSDK